MKPSRPWTIAIDGPAGAGKSSAARGLARALGLRYVDTGAMYRALALRALQAERSVPSPSLLPLLEKTDLRLAWEDGATRVWLDGREVTGRLRSQRVARAASRLAQDPGVRRLLVRRQRRMAAGGGVVMEGRDIGTVVLPKADVKFYLDASLEERSRRRFRELKAAGRGVRIAAVARAVQERDAKDLGRRASPLRPAEDALVVDTTGFSQARTLRELLRRVLGGARAR